MTGVRVRAQMPSAPSSQKKRGSGEDRRGDRFPVFLFLFSVILKFLLSYRDEDEEMRRFIEMEMDKRRRGSGRPGPDDPSEAQNTYMSPEDAALSSLPAHLKSSMSKKSEEMLSSQMLSGIPEVLETLPEIQIVTNKRYYKRASFYNETCDFRLT